MARKSKGVFRRVLFGLSVLWVGQAGALDQPVGGLPIDRLAEIRAKLLDHDATLDEAAAHEVVSPDSRRERFAQWLNFPNYWNNWGNWGNWRNW